MTDVPDATVEDVTLPITIEREEVCHVGFRDLVNYTYREINSAVPAHREIVTAHQAVVIVAYDPALDKLVMIRQFRLGAQLGTGLGFSVEFAAGIIDDGESPQSAARRELLEETGLEAVRLQPMFRFLTSPGLSDEVLQVFYAHVDAQDLSRQSGQAEENEQTFPFLVSLEQALQAVDSNSIYNGIVMTALMWFARNRNKLMEDFQ